MGWLFYTDRRVRTYADEKAEIDRLCSFETDTRKTVLLKACKVGSTWYAAARITTLDGAPVEDATYVTDADVNRQAILTPYRRPRMTPMERSGSWPDAV